MRISDWSSDVCSSDLDAGEIGLRETHLAQPVEPSCMSPLAAQRADIEGFRAQRHGERRIVELRIVSQGDNGGAAVGCERRQRVVRRSEGRRVGKECVSTGRTRWELYH